MCSVLCVFSFVVIKNCNLSLLATFNFTPQKKFIRLCTSWNYCRSYHRMWTGHVNRSLHIIRPMKTVVRILIYVAGLYPTVDRIARWDVFLSGDVVQSVCDFGIHSLKYPLTIGAVSRKEAVYWACVCTEIRFVRYMAQFYVSYATACMLSCPSRQPAQNCGCAFWHDDKFRCHSRVSLRKCWSGCSDERTFWKTIPSDTEERKYKLYIYVCVYACVTFVYIKSEVVWSSYKYLQLDKHYNRVWSSKQERTEKHTLVTMVKSRSPSPVYPYKIGEINFPVLTFEEARALPLLPTPPELIRDDTPSTHNYTPQLPSDNPILLRGWESPSFTRGHFATQSPEERATFVREEVAFVHQGLFHSPGGVSFTRGRFIHQGAFHSPDYTRNTILVIVYLLVSVHICRVVIGCNASIHPRDPSALLWTYTRRPVFEVVIRSPTSISTWLT